MLRLFFAFIYLFHVLGAENLPEDAKKVEFKKVQIFENEGVFNMLDAFANDSCEVSYEKRGELSISLTTNKDSKSYAKNLSLNISEVDIIYFRENKLFYTNNKLKGSFREYYVINDDLNVLKFIRLEYNKEGHLKLISISDLSKKRPFHYKSCWSVNGQK